MNPKQLAQRKQQRIRTPRLDRRNAAKNIEYDAEDTSSEYESPGGSFDRGRTRSLDLTLEQLLSNKTSFRIDGESEDEVHMLCRSLGLSGPEDFAISTAVWEARPGRTSSDLLPRSRLFSSGGGAGDALASTPRVSDEVMVPTSNAEEMVVPSSNTEEEVVEDHGYLAEEFRSGVRVRDWQLDSRERSHFAKNGDGFDDGSGGGIKGPRPPMLAPPPVMSLPVLEKPKSPWDLVRSLAPEADSDDDDHQYPRRAGRSCYWEHEKEDEDALEGNDDVDGRLSLPGTADGDFAGSSSFTTSNDDDSPVADGMYVSGPSNCRQRRNIVEWTQGKELGRGSFGTVYEAISYEGFFFAVKEVSLLDQGADAQQCIQQLEQEIALLSNFEHENIVQYLGTKKEEAKLYIYLELVSQGSLASLYQKYDLRDSQVSAYTRQILNGLKYLHDRNVVHRDIKCANILVDASGSVKLADFGLAKETSKINMLKSCKGSVYWMAPEVVKPRRPYGPAADIWSLGCTVLEMLTRKLPYPNLEWMQAFFKIGRGEAPSIPDSLSTDARDFLSQCLQVEPDDRPTPSKLLDHPFVKRQISTIGSGNDSSSHGRRT